MGLPQVYGVVKARRPGCRRAQISAQSAGRHRAHAAGNGVVRLECEHGTHRGFFGVQALHDRRFHRGGHRLVHFCPGFSRRARAGRRAAVARQIDGGYGPSALGESPLVEVIQVWAYVLVVAGIWFTVTPWRLRDFINWATATESRTRLLSGVRLAFAAFVLILGLTTFRAM